MDDSVSIPVFTAAGKRGGQESVPASRVSGRRWRLSASPGVAEGYAAEDLVEVVRRSRPQRSARRSLFRDRFVPIQRADEVRPC